MEVKEGRDWLTEIELAERLPITASTLRNHRHQGIGFPYAKYGRNVFYSWREVQQCLAKSSVRPDRKECGHACTCER